MKEAIPDHPWMTEFNTGIRLKKNVDPWFSDWVNIQLFLIKHAFKIRNRADASCAD